MTKMWFYDSVNLLKALLSRWSRILRLAGTTILVVVLCWFFGWLLVGDQWLLIRWGAFVAPWLALLALFSAGLLALGRRPWRATLALGTGLLILTPVLPRFSPARWFASPQAGDLRVMTFNASDLNTDFTAIAKLIVREKPDIVFLQQIQDLTALQAAIRREPGHIAYQSFPAQTADTVILSRFPLSGGRLFRDQRTTALTAIGKCRIRLWDLHAPHGQFEITDQQRFFADAAASMRDEKLSIIAAGDLNSTEFSSVQAPLRAILYDTYEGTGSGFGFTFPSSVRHFGWLGRLFRIDHVLYRGDLEPVGINVLGDNAGSDHFPTVADFRLAGHCR